MDFPLDIHLFSTLGNPYVQKAQMSICYSISPSPFFHVYPFIASCSASQYHCNSPSTKVSLCGCISTIGLLSPGKNSCFPYSLSILHKSRHFLLNTSYPQLLTNLSHTQIQTPINSILLYVSHRGRQLQMDVHSLCVSL